MRSPSRLSAHAAVGLAIATLAAAGCGISDPLDDLEPSDPGAVVDHPNEVELDGPVDLRAATSARSPAPTPKQAVERFAERYINWNHRTLADVQRHLAQTAVGEAAATQQRAAARTPSDSELRRSQIANHGQIIGIAAARPPRTGDFVLVTRETTTGARVYDELAPAYHVTLATVTRVRGGWAVSRWEPQS